MKKQKENYEVDEARMSGAEIGNLIERLQNLKYGEHVHLQIGKNKEFMINKEYKKPRS